GSFPPFVLLSFVFPFLFGGAFSLPLLFPWDVVGDSGFIGILPTFTAIMAAIVLRKSRGDVRFWSIIALFALLAMFNRYTPFGKLLYLLPVYNIFRYQARFLVGLDLAMAMLFAIGIDAVLLNREMRQKYSRAFLAIASFFVVVGLCIATI